MVHSRAVKDGLAARDEEKVKRRRYGPQVSPFVLEAGGRPGASARALLMKYAVDETNPSSEIGLAWQQLSCILQGETALGILTAWGGSAALASGRARLSIL